VNDYSKELEWTVPNPLDLNYWEHHSTNIIIAKYADALTGHVADAGCNNGIAVAMLSLLTRVESVTGLDISEHALDMARSMLEYHPKCKADKIGYVQCNLADMPCFCFQFDSVLCLHTLEHIYPDDMAAVVSGLHRILKPGGRLVFSVPCRDAFGNSPAHVMRFSPGEDPGYCNLRDVLERGGFTVAEIYEDATLNSDTELCITGLAIATG